MSDLLAEFIRRAESGSKAAYKPLAEALPQAPELVPGVAALLGGERPLVVQGAARALGALAEAHPRLVAPHAGALVAVARGEDVKAREAAFEALATLAARAPEAVAPGIDVFVEAFRAERRVAARATAALCLARMGLAPDLRPRVVPAFVEHLRENPRDKQARDILVAMGELAGAPLDEEERAELAGAVALLRSHPNLQVRERAGRIWRSLGAHR